ncbi:hypothetical protein BURKHO8Y_70236 [Burkholderia sp. 8Y]|nr:hypothetical protein BURKHO8Y_70236 [Burkholderia sp. 8Y]
MHYTQSNPLSFFSPRIGQCAKRGFDASIKSLFKEITARALKAAIAGRSRRVSSAEALASAMNRHSAHFRFIFADA